MLDAPKELPTCAPPGDDNKPAASKSKRRALANKPIAALVYVNPGTYQIAFASHATAVLFGRAPKLILTFKIVSMGSDFGKYVCRYYNVKKLRGRPGRGGWFEYSERSDVFREYCGLFHAPGPAGILMESFENVIIEAEIGTCNTDRAQRQIPEGAQYSRIIRLHRVVEGHVKGN